MAELAGRVAIVTGASSGIGRSIALRFAGAGARVAITARRRSLLEELAEQHPESLHPISGDITEAAFVDELFADVEEKLGAVTLVVNAAGQIDPERVERTTPERWDATFAVNVRSMFLTSRRAIDGMRRAGGGSIINIASISGIPGPQKFPGFVSYCASKAAVIGLTEALAVELREHDIRVNAISPGSVDTPMLRRASDELVPDMTPDEIAEVALFLASDRSRPIGGQNIHVFGA